MSGSKPTFHKFFPPYTLSSLSISASADLGNVCQTLRRLNFVFLSELANLRTFILRYTNALIIIIIIIILIIIIIID